MNTITTKAKDLRRGDILAGAFDRYVVRAIRQQAQHVYINLRNTHRHGLTRSAVLRVPSNQSVEIVNTYGEELAS
jgi:hypothetical protein